MTPPTPLLVLNAMVAGAVVIVVLYTLAVFVRCSIELHQLKVETHRLRIAYLRKVAALRGGGEAGEPIEVEVLEEGAGLDEIGTPAAVPQPAPQMRQAA